MWFRVKKGIIGWLCRGENGGIDDVVKVINVCFLNIDDLGRGVGVWFRG